MTRTVSKWEGISDINYLNILNIYLAWMLNMQHKFFNSCFITFFMSWTQFYELIHRFLQLHCQKTFTKRQNRFIFTIFTDVQYWMNEHQFISTHTGTAMNGDMHKSAFVVFFCKASILMFLQCECELFDDNVDVIKMIKGNFLFISN